MVHLISRLWLLNMIFLSAIASQAPQHYQTTPLEENELDRADYALLLSNRRSEQLMDACLLNNIAKAQYLLEHGTTLNAKNRRGREPIHLAALNGFTTIVKLLLDFKANINAQDYEKIKPIHVAAYNGYTETAKLLLERGAVSTAQTSNGFTPTHCAARRGHPETLRVLLNHELNQLEEPYNEIQKINLIATTPRSLPADIVSIIIAYKGLDCDIPIVENDNNKPPLDLLHNLFSPLDLFFNTFFSPITTYITEPYTIPSTVNTTCFGETALVLTAQSLIKENDPQKQLALKECASLLEKQPERVIQKLIKRALENNV